MTRAVSESLDSKRTKRTLVRIQDSRRLTGLNLLSPRAGAVAEVQFEPDEHPEACIARWSGALDRVLDALGWEVTPRWTRRYDDAATLLFDAPLDALYAATEINEWAIAEASGEAPPLATLLTALDVALAEEANPRLRDLEVEAARRGLPFVWDDDHVSIGMGCRSMSWPTEALPRREDVPWEALGAVPVGYVTGTNGKTTTTRMTARIVQASGRTSGATSSDGVVVNGRHIERGDWTGTGAARRVLRHPEVEVAVLETARGGMLRRGLVIDRCDAALITNVASDHLGEYGVHTVADMARVKGLVCRAVHPQGRRILNGDDPLVRALGDEAGAPVCWFSVEGVSDWLRPHLEAGGEAWVLESGWLCAYVGLSATRVVEAAQIPATHGGAARHNISNALGAAALSQTLGASLDDVREGLMSFGSEAKDNPGRCQLQEVDGVQLLLDFGHNPHGVRAMLTMARGLMAQRPGARLWVSVGQAGDRSDDDLFGLSEAIWEVRPEMVSLRDIVGYERGRAPREAVDVMLNGLTTLGHPAAAIRLHDDEVHAIRDGLSWARPGDLIVHLVHIQRDAVTTFLVDRAP